MLMYAAVFTLDLNPLYSWIYIIAMYTHGLSLHTDKMHSYTYVQVYFYIWVIFYLLV